MIHKVILIALRLTGDVPLAKSDEEDKCTDTETNLACRDAEEDGQAYAEAHLADATLIVAVVRPVGSVFQYLVGNGLAILHGDLCQLVFLPAVLVDEIEQRYNVQSTPFDVKATLGEFDAPELQQQGIIQHDFLEQEGTLIYGTDGGERDQLINAMVYSVAKHHTPEEVNFYFLDYGSESVRMFAKLPHIGGMVFNGEQEKYNNLLKLIYEETSYRKKLFVDYGGDYKNYIKNSGQKLPIMVIVFNNFDAINEMHTEMYDIGPELFRDSDRYGIVYIVTCNSNRSMAGKLSENFPTRYALRLKEAMEYEEVLGAKTKQVPSDKVGRGMLNNNGVHEFQTASLVEDEAKLSKFILDFCEKQAASTELRAKKIPTLPERVTFEDVKEKYKPLSSIPVGINKQDLSIFSLNFSENPGSIISANKISGTKKYVKSYIKLLKNLGIGTILIDGTKDLADMKTDVANYFDENFDENFNKIKDVIAKSIESGTDLNATMIMYGLDKIISKLDDTDKIEELFNEVKKYEKLPTIIVDDCNKLRNFQFDNWFKALYGNPEGIWVGSGAGDQTLLKLNGYDKALSGEFPNNIGFYIAEGMSKTIKLIELVEDEGEEDE